MAFYLKYRPQKIDELDSKIVKQQLEKILMSPELPHAFLFSGPKGLGKTSAARILAKAVNCSAKDKTTRPCNQCRNCLSITKGASLDIIEIDAASNRGIDDVRALRETIKLATSQLAYKVYIIDEVHMLTTEAFNALLKTLEEPPKHVIFVLATTEAWKLPGTVISRCLQIKFSKATVGEIINSLQRIVKAEKLEPEPGVLEFIAGLSDASFRDAAKILEQLSFGGKKISLVNSQKIFSHPESGQIDLFIKKVLVKDLTGALQVLEQEMARGTDVSWFTTQVLAGLRQFLWQGAGPELLALIKAVDAAGVQAKTSLIPQLPLEISIVEWIGEAVPAKVISNVPETKKSSKTKFEDITASWDKFLRMVRPHNNSIEALLRSTKPVALEKNLLTLEVFYKFHKERLESGKCPEVLEKLLLELFGEKIKISCVLGKKKPGGIRIDSKDHFKKAEEIFLKGGD